MIAMESPGSFWNPLYNIFEQEHLPAVIVNACHIKNVLKSKPNWSETF